MGLKTGSGDHNYDESELTIKYTYAGWNTSAKDAPNYIDAGTYSVELTLKSNNFAFDVSGTKSTTLTFNISALDLATLPADRVKAIVQLADGFKFGDGSSGYTITKDSGEIIYTGYEITPVSGLLGYQHDSEPGSSGSGGMTYKLTTASYSLAYADNTNATYDGKTATVRITGAQQERQRNHRE